MALNKNEQETSKPSDAYYTSRVANEKREEKKATF